MREILFRGKTKDGEWVYGNLIKRLNYDELSVKYYAIQEITSVSSHNFARVFLETVGQYTGLYDKNGTKIFEGDIVKIYWQEKTATIGFIKYVNCLCRFTIVEHGVPYGFDDTTPLEVIGNIHDNPELLEEQL